jgi:hypothetical protein
MLEIPQRVVSALEAHKVWENEVLSLADTATDR